MQKRIISIEPEQQQALATTYPGLCENNYKNTLQTMISYISTAWSCGTKYEYTAKEMRRLHNRAHRIARRLYLQQNGKTARETWTCGAQYNGQHLFLQSLPIFAAILSWYERDDTIHLPPGDGNFWVDIKYRMGEPIRRGETVPLVGNNLAAIDYRANAIAFEKQWQERHAHTMEIPQLADLNDDIPF